MYDQMTCETVSPVLNRARHLQRQEYLLEEVRDKLMDGQLCREDQLASQRLAAHLALGRGAYSCSALEPEPEEADAEEGLAALLPQLEEALKEVLGAYRGELLRLLHQEVTQCKHDGAKDKPVEVTAEEVAQAMKQAGGDGDLSDPLIPQIAMVSTHLIEAHRIRRRASEYGLSPSDEDDAPTELPGVLRVALVAQFEEDVTAWIDRGQEDAQALFADQIRSSLGVAPDVEAAGESVAMETLSTEKAEHSVSAVGVLEAIAGQLFAAYEEGRLEKVIAVEEIEQQDAEPGIFAPLWAMCEDWSKTMWEDCSKPGEAEEKKSTPGVFVDEPESTLKPGIFVDQIQLGPFEDALGPPDELSTCSFWLRLKVRVWLHRWHHRSVTQRSLPTAVV